MPRPRTSIFALALALMAAPAIAHGSERPVIDYLPDGPYEAYSISDAGVKIRSVDGRVYAVLPHERAHSIIDGRGVHVAINCGWPHPDPQCGGGVTPPGGLKQITLDDLKAALALANAQTPPDTRHAQCWSALIPFVQGFAPFGPPANTPGGGLATAAQTFFDLQARAGQPLFPDAVLSACGPTVYDLKIDFLKLGAALGLAVVSPIHVPVFP